MTGDRPSSTTAAFRIVAVRLRAILEPYAARLIVTADDPDGYSLDVPPSRRFPKGMFFGATRVGKRYVSFHLMLVYVYPDLLDGMSPALRKRMQGKSCFNFTSIDERLVDELAALTAAGVERYRADRPDPADARSAHPVAPRLLRGGTAD
jgi:hypothetical protein